MNGYPRWFVPGLVAALLLMLATGLLLAPTTLALRAEMAVPWRLPGSGRVLCAAIHAAGGFAMVLLVGALWSLHMRAGWRARKQVVSGSMLGIVMLLLAASAVIIYYAGDEGLGVAAALFHLGTGVAVVIPFAWHWWHGRQVRMRFASSSWRRQSL